MNVPTISMPKHEARRKYLEYLRGVKERTGKEYEHAKRAFRELSHGRTVIDLAAAMASAGVDERGRPRLAVGPADAKLCWFRYASDRWRDAAPTFSPDDWFSGAQGRKRRTRLPVETFKIAADQRQRMKLRAVVPLIPPGLLPSGDLSRYTILWEAEWETLPVDPMLLRHLGGTLYVVLATWDLSPVERAVLTERLS